MLFRELPRRNQMQIVDATMCGDREYEGEPVTEEDREVLQQWANDPRNFRDEEEEDDE